jgi:type IV secretion system protein VirD4
MAYAANRAETAKTISELMGLTTASKKQRSLSGKGVFGARSVSESDQEFARPLMTPDEVLRLPFDDALLFVGGMPPYRGRKVMYYLDRRLAPRAGLAPPESPRAQRRELVRRAPIEWETLPPQVAPPSPPAAPAFASEAGSPVGPIVGGGWPGGDGQSESAWAELFGQPASEVDEDPDDEPNDPPPHQKLGGLL